MDLHEPVIRRSTQTACAIFWVINASHVSRHFFRQDVNSKLRYVGLRMRGRHQYSARQQTQKVCRLPSREKNVTEYPISVLEQIIGC